MSYLLTRWLLTLCVCTGLCAGTMASAANTPSTALVLGDGTASFDVGSEVQTWLDIGALASVGEIYKLSDRFESTPVTKRHLLSERDALWVKLRVVQPAGGKARWTVNIPLPFLDLVTLYQHDAEGNWITHAGGDAVFAGKFSKSSLYPDFELQLQPGVPQDIYLQVRNFKPVVLPIRLANAAERNSQRLVETMCLGLLLGAVVCLALQSLARYQEHRKDADALAALYAFLIAVALAQINGVLNTFVWGSAAQWENYANSVLPMLAVACTLFFVRNLYMLSTHFNRYEVFMARTVVLCLASLLSYVFLDRASADWIGGIVLFFAALVGLVAAILSWQGGSAIGRTLTIAYIPQFLGLLPLCADALALFPMAWQMRYLTTASVAFSVPALLYALRRATHARKEIEVRAAQLPTQDALTGLLTPQAFDIQLQDAYHRALDDRDRVALVVVNVINLRHIRESLGDEAAEQCLLRAVIKLHRVLRDVDPAGRIGPARFAMLMEGVTSRQEVHERLVKLIASGLIPVQGLKPDVTLQFQAACVLLHENPLEPTRAMERLEALLAEMSPRTRRPIRYVEPEPTQAASLGGSLEARR
jgi:GGDEF domain-containing protein